MPPPPHLPAQFYNCASLLLLNSEENPGRPVTLGLGRYSATPLPGRYNSVIGNIALNVTPPPGDYVEGTGWSFPLNVEEWEKAVGYNRPGKSEKELLDIPRPKIKHTKTTIVINIEGVLLRSKCKSISMVSRTITR